MQQTATKAKGAAFRKTKQGGKKMNIEVIYYGHVQKLIVRRNG